MIMSIATKRLLIGLAKAILPVVITMVANHLQAKAGCNEQDEEYLMLS